MSEPLNRKFHVAIIGAGPAGITAAVQLARANLSVLLIEKRKPGGTIEVAWRVENLPSFKCGTSGKVIAARLAEHLAGFDIFLVHDEVKRVTTGKTFVIQTAENSYRADKVIVACGLEPLKLQVPDNIETFKLDIFSEPAKQQSRILIVGSGDVAFDQALKLHYKGHEVVIVHRRKEVKALKRLVKMAEEENIPHLVSKDCQWRVKNDRFFRDDLESEKGFDYLLPCIGREISSVEIVSDYGILDYQRQQDKIVSEVDGLYFAGDIIRGKKRQVSIAMGDGMNAALTILAKMAE